MTIIKEEKIENRAVYTERMQRSMIDKIFFLDKIDADCIVDFGCANGALLKVIEKFTPETTLIGYDKDPVMISDANASPLINGTFTTSWKTVEDICANHKKPAILLSSVIHEVYSYCSEEEISQFWKTVFHGPFKTIIIRDMSMSRTASRTADPLLVARIKQISSQEKINQWETMWGSLHENWSMIHWLMTYPYEDNWEREVRENYFPITLEDLLSKIPPEYKPELFEHYTLPYFRKRVFKDYGIQVQEKTHIKLILEKD